MLTSPAAIIIANTASMLASLDYSSSEWKNNLEKIATYKHQCEENTSFFKNFLQAIGVILFVSLGHISNFGICAIIGLELLPVGKSIFGIPDDDSLLKRLLFQPSGKLQAAATEVVTCARQYVKPATSHYFSFFNHIVTVDNSESRLMFVNDVS